MRKETLLYRQVSPDWIKANRVTSQTFRPTPKDEGKLSAYDGDQITAEASWQHFTSVPDRHSVGVLAVTVDECESQAVPAIPDPKKFPEHVSIDFTGLTHSKARDIGKLLTRIAVAKGWQFRPKSQS